MHVSDAVLDIDWYIEALDITDMKLGDYTAEVPVVITCACYCYLAIGVKHHPSIITQIHALLLA